MRRLTMMLGIVLVAMLVGVGPAVACGFLVAPNGSVQLVRTTTLAAYHDGLEHYITSFEYAGGATDFGSIIPLPGIPDSVERGGNWTLQRLIRETQPLPTIESAACVNCAFAAADDVEIILETQIDALDITLLSGGGPEVVEWAADNGYFLPDEAEAVLEFYSSRSSIFMAARFDASRAADLGQSAGDGTPIHVTIPTDDPWVPLHILAMGKAPGDVVEADVYLLTDAEPNVLPRPHSGLQLQVSEPASTSLLDDLRSDQGMAWVPESAWLTYLRVDTPASGLSYDLAIDAEGDGAPSRIAAGFGVPGFAAPRAESTWLLFPLFAIVAAGVVVLVVGPIAVAKRHDESP